MAEEYRSGLSDDEVEDLARKIMGIVCEEMPSPRNPLESAAIHDRLMREGVELPRYAMADAIEVIEGMVLFQENPRRHYLGGLPNPDDPDHIEAVRTHASATIVGIRDLEYCDEF